MNWFLLKNKASSYTEALQMYKEARAPRNYKREYAQYHSKPQRVAERSQRNQARRIVGLKKGDPREVDHKNPISNGGSNARSNLRAVSLVENRKKFTKTAGTRHHLITGVPGAGKSTVAKRIAKEKGLPLFEIDSDPRFKRALQLVDEGKLDESNALQRQMFRDAVSRKDPHVIEGAQIMLDPTLARQHELQILDDSADVLAPRWAKREADKHRDRALKSGRTPYKDESYYDKLYRDTVYPRYHKQLEGLRKTANDREWNPEIERQSRVRGQQLYDMYEAGGRADNWRNSSLVEKRANTQHYLVTGHSGAGKSTFSNKLSKEKGIPVHALDWDPEVEKLWEYQKGYAKKNDGKLDMSDKRKAYEKKVKLDAIHRALKMKDPRVIEGSYLMYEDPAAFGKHKRYLVNPSKETVLEQRLNRKKQKDIKRGREWTPEAERQARYRGSEVYDLYEPYAKKWRDSSLVEKVAADPQLPPPPIEGYTGRWTTVGSGRLGIPKPGVSDVDYMVPVEDLPSTEGFSPFQQYTSAYKRNFDMPGYRGGSIVALPEGPYRTIDDSYASAVKKYTPDQLRSMKDAKDKLDFYKDIGVVLTDDAMKLHNKTAENTPELNRWLEGLGVEAKRRGYTGFHAVADDSRHPLGGGSYHYVSKKNKKSPVHLLRKAMVDWESSQGLDPNHDWRKK